MMAILTLISVCQAQREAGGGGDGGEETTAEDGKDFADRTEDVLADDRLVELALAMTAGVLESAGFSANRFGLQVRTLFVLWRTEKCLSKLSLSFLQVFLAATKANTPAATAAQLEKSWVVGSHITFSLESKNPRNKPI